MELAVSLVMLLFFQIFLPNKKVHRKQKSFGLYTGFLTIAVRKFSGQKNIEFSI